ncbi:uncharacterized protein CLUP02_00112 [Colletotrichum lupini]|uniref:Uncharacterized protein n=1 Tax=Colletotrichum lupini TaxID=145971 RepID=A0A9Q8S930_9PEZI|nr:uncharacterized protein CLUP02_00112 [Colletotrichum lupini]KAK1718980.1 hypothetical protein BDP67DRAFT_169926 [Colletotrichum lupini]UQC73467.1 hypothetical protein CLUP02_00112 [Colletotrichum lupini]
MLYLCGYAERKAVATDHLESRKEPLSWIHWHYYCFLPSNSPLVASPHRNIPISLPCCCPVSHLEGSAPGTVRSTLLRATIIWQGFSNRQLLCRIKSPPSTTCTSSTTCRCHASYQISLAHPHPSSTAPRTRIIKYRLSYRAAHFGDTKVSRRHGRPAFRVSNLPCYTDPTSNELPLSPTCQHILNITDQLFLFLPSNNEPRDTSQHITLSSESYQLNTTTNVVPI